MWNDSDHASAIARTPVDAELVTAPIGRLATFGAGARVITHGFAGSKGSRVDPPAIVHASVDTRDFSLVTRVIHNLVVHCGEIERREHPKLGWPTRVKRQIAIMAEPNGTVIVIAEPAREEVLCEPA